MIIRSFIIPTTPVAWARPRYNSKTKHFFDKQVKEKELYQLLVRKNYAPEQVPFFKGAINIDITFYMPLPQKNAKKKRSEQYFHTSRPDLSNLIKFVEDALQGLLFNDDSSISIITAKKVYDENPRTHIFIATL